jgi:transposase-like protein
MASPIPKWNKATKFKVALEAYKADRSVTEIAEEYGIHPTQVHRWKKELMEHGPGMCQHR